MGVGTWPTAKRELLICEIRERLQLFLHLRTLGTKTLMRYWRHVSASSSLRSVGTAPMELLRLQLQLLNSVLLLPVHLRGVHCLGSAHRRAVEAAAFAWHPLTLRLIRRRCGRDTLTVEQLEGTVKVWALY
jgi:hypothetical protein